MANYEVDYAYSIKEYGTHVLEAADKDAAELETRNYLLDNFDQIFGIEIEEVREVKV